MESSLQMGEKPEFSEAVLDTKTPMPEETTAQVERLLASQPFQHSDSNRQLLLFLAQRAISHPGQTIKEIELATSVFGLSLETFDPQSDSAVRVKVGRLRAKLLEYYAHYGMNDEVILEIPKGAYCLVSQYRQGIEPRTPPSVGIPPLVEGEKSSVGEQISSTSQQNERKWYWWVASLLLGITLGSFGTLFYLRSIKHAIPSHLEQFWSSFYKNGEPLIAVFSNPRLAGIISRGGLHYFQSNNAPESSEEVNLGYSGAGDVYSIHELTRLFDLFHWDLTVQSGALLSWATAEHADLIFIGRPEQNPALYELPRLREFYFKYNEGIINAHPQPGEKDSYPYSYDYDYAVIAFVPGIHPQENTLILAGDTTWGSQAAVECMTTDRCVSDLLNKLQVRQGQNVPYFEALLKVKINNNVPVWNTVIAIRHYPTDASSWQAPMPNER
jgi:hypothetical protein